MKYIDTHCHVDMILQKAQHFGSFAELRQEFPTEYESLIQICCHPGQIAWTLDFLNQNPDCFGAFGVHPHDASLYNSQVHEELKKALSHPQVRALGECGLDYFYEQSPRDVQIPVFEQQLVLAQELELPLVLHTRSADADTLDVLKSHLNPNTKVHVHCFTGEADFAKQLLELSEHIYFGFTGILTFKNAENVRESLRQVPLNRLLLETDGPFLAPVPHRGKVAHPGHIPWTAAQMAEIKGVSLEDLYIQVRTNTQNVFGI